MSKISHKPVINQVIRTWRVQPGMTFAIAEDIEGALWVVESCPAGTHFWTIEQAADLSQGVRTRRPLQEAVALGRERQSLSQLPSLPCYDAELEAAIASAPGHFPRRSAVHGRELVQV